MNITRSYARKVNKGNYETEDFFASFSQDFDDELNQMQIDEASMNLFRMAKVAVEKEIERKEIERKEIPPEIAEMIERVRLGGSMSVDEYERVVYAGFAIPLNDAKKEYKRSPEYKAEEATRKNKHQ